MKNSIVGLILVSLMLIGCSSKDSSSKIGIGVLLPLTGDLASYGEPMKEGMEIALTYMDSVGENNVKLVYSDSKADPKIAISGFKRLTDFDHVQYIIGDVSSPVTLSLIPLLESANVFLLSPGASSPKLGGISPLFARNYPSSVDESRESALFAKTQIGVDSAIGIYVNSEYGIGLRDMFESTFTENGGKIVYSELYEVGRTNFRDIILKLSNSQGELIYLGGNQKEMGAFVKQARELGLKDKIISNISFLREDCLSIAGEAAEGVIVPVADFDPTSSMNSKSYEYGNYYNHQTGKEINIPVAVGFDAVMLITEAIDKVGNNPQKVADYIRDLNEYQGALGNLSFKDGDVAMPTTFKVIKDGVATDYQEEE